MHERIIEYSTRQVGAIVGWSDRRVRYWARAGLVAAKRSAAGHYRYSFQDIVTLRTVRALLAERVAPGRAGRIIRAIAEQLPPGRGASSVQVLAQGRRVVARDALSSWEPENRQTVLDFGTGPRGGVSLLRSRGEAVNAGRRDASAESAAADWFQRGLEAETAGRLADAQYSYANACRADAAHAAARVNLGRLWHAQGKLREAHRLYREALAIAPDDATAWFNLGVVLEDGGDLRNAISSYLRAIDRAPDVPDAHYNLARLYQQRGDLKSAVRHFSRYKSLTRRR